MAIDKLSSVVYLTSQMTSGRRAAQSEKGPAMWRSFEDDPPKQDGRKILAWARYEMDEYDEDDRLIARGKVVDEPVILYSCPPFEGWMQPGARMVQNATYIYWQEISPPAGARL